MNHVRLEVMPWLSRYFDSEASDRVVLEKDVAEGARVVDLLNEVTCQRQELKRILFDEGSDGLVSHVVVVLNGRLLELVGGLDAKLKDGDTIRLIAGIVGG
jgi:molybdopterin converting factor small subunit